MAMNKKEQAEFAELRRKLAMALAFRQTQAVEKDVPIPKAGYSHGFDFNIYNHTITEYWSGFTSHYTEDPTGKKGYFSGSQNGKPLYSTRLLALKALRHAVENQAAKDLADIDIEIASEGGK